MSINSQLDSIFYTFGDFIDFSFKKFLNIKRETSIEIDDYVFLDGGALCLPLVTTLNSSDDDDDNNTHYSLL